MSFSPLLWPMEPSLAPSSSVSLFLYYILRAIYILLVDVIYDTMHYAYAFFILTAGSSLNDRYSSMHHTKLPAYLREQKKYHLANHYKNFELGFGVTSMSFLGVVALSSNVGFQAKFGTTCLTQCFHFKCGAIPYSFSLRMVF